MDLYTGAEKRVRVNLPGKVALCFHPRRAVHMSIQGKYVHLCFDDCLGKDHGRIIVNISI